MLGLKNYLLFITFLSLFIKRAVAECRPPILLRPPRILFVKVSGSKSGNTPALYAVVGKSIEDVMDTVIPGALLSVFCQSKVGLFLTH